MSANRHSLSSTRKRDWGFCTCAARSTIHLTPTKNIHRKPYVIGRRIFWPAGHFFGPCRQATRPQESKQGASPQVVERARTNNRVSPCPDFKVLEETEYGREETGPASTGGPATNPDSKKIRVLNSQHALYSYAYSSIEWVRTHEDGGRTASDGGWT